MALQKQYEDIYGTVHAAAYHRVVKITMFIDRQVAIAELFVYKDVDARNNNKAPLYTVEYQFETNQYPQVFTPSMMEQKNPIKGVYDIVKTYPEFSGAIDV